MRKRIFVCVTPTFYFQKELGNNYLDKKTRFMLYRARAARSDDELSGWNS